MTHLRRAVFEVMDRACKWSGHRLECYNRPRLATRVWLWAQDIHIE